MSKLHLFFKGIIYIYIIIQLISNFLYNNNMPLSMKVHVHYMNLMKNQFIQKFQSLKFWKKRPQGRGFISKTILHFYFILMSSKCLVWGAGHMCMK
jgi:hypothetical protein